MLLQTKGQMTAGELSERLEVSTRTIYRDLDALSMAGVPVYAERGVNGGCMLLESYRSNLTGLKEDEVRALFMFTVPGLLADLGVGKASEAALLKLQATLPAPFQQDIDRLRQRIHLDASAWFQPPEAVPHLHLFQEAVWQDERLRILYRRGDGQWVKRVVEPYGLVAKASVWYAVVAFAGQVWTQERPLTLRLSRVQTATPTGTPFERLGSFDLVTFWQTWCQQFERQQAKYDVQLAVTDEGASRLVRRMGDSVVALLTAGQLDAQGRTHITLSFASSVEAQEMLLGLGTAVEILSPPSLREQLRKEALAIARFYR